MKTIIGLLENEELIDPAVKRLQQAGITGEKIQVVSNTNAVASLLGCEPACVIKNYTLIGAGAGVVIYAFYGLAAALCECNLLHYGKGYGIGVFLGALLAGALVGGIIGFMVGAGEAEKDSHLYVQGIRMGGKVISVQVPDRDCARLQQLLQIEHVHGVKVLNAETA